MPARRLQRCKKTIATTTSYVLLTGLVLRHHDYGADDMHIVCDCLQPPDRARWHLVTMHMREDEKHRRNSANGAIIARAEVPSNDQLVSLGCMQ